MLRAFDLHPRKCKTCGKKFEARPEYAYKYSPSGEKFYWFCSYHCLQDYKREHKPKQKRHYGTW